MQADAYRHAHAVARDEMGLMQGAQGVEQRQAGMHGAVRGVFVGLGPAKVDQQAVAEILGDIAIIGLERGRRRGLVGTHHGAVVFGIELLGEFGRGDQVAEHHRDLPAFGLEGAAARLRRERWPVLRGLGWDAVRGQWRGSRGGRRGGVEGRGGHARRRCAPYPDQALAVLVAGQALEEEILPQVRQPRLVQATYPRQAAIGQPSLALQQRPHQHQHSGVAIVPHETCERPLGRAARLPRPDETSPRVVADLRVGVEEGVLEIVEGIIVQVKLPLQGAVG